jgi:poly(3-hydroxybutyrate) depolymerase
MPEAGAGRGSSITDWLAAARISCIHRLTTFQERIIAMLHGCAQSAEDFAVGTRMNELADAHQFIVVYQQQTTLNNAAVCWNWFMPTNQMRGSGEPTILAGIVKTVEQDTSQ